MLTEPGNNHTKSQMHPEPGALIDSLIEGLFGAVNIPEPDTNAIHDIVQQFCDKWERYPCWNCDTEKAKAWRRDLLTYMEAGIFDLLHQWACERVSGKPIE